MKIFSYKVKEYNLPTKRFCQTLELKNDPALIEEYRRLHSQETSMAKLAGLPGQSEWERLMNKYQACEPGSSSSEKWQQMERMFYLYE